MNKNKTSFSSSLINLKSFSFCSDKKQKTKTSKSNQTNLKCDLLSRIETRKKLLLLMLDFSFCFRVIVHSSGIEAESFPHFIRLMNFNIKYFLFHLDLSEKRLFVQERNNKCLKKKLCKLMIDVRKKCVGQKSKYVKSK
jgi:hypothetical protein